MSSNTAQEFCDEPRSFFGTARNMYSIPYVEIRRLQLAALQHRFEALRPKVKLLDKLAARNGVDGIEDLATGGKLLYPSNVYKSYPFSWLEEGNYKRLTNWVQQLTTHDLSKVNLDGVVMLDDWFARLEEVTDLRLCHSSSTTGKLSFVPRGVDEWIRRTRTTLFVFEAAGNEDGPEEASLEGMPQIGTFYKYGHSATLAGNYWMTKILVDPEGKYPDRSLTLHPGRMSSEIMVLAGRLRAGQLSGDPRSMQLPQRLIERRSQLTELLAGTTGERINDFVTEARDRFGGQRVLLGGVWPSMVDAATAALGLGHRDVFASNSLIMSGGGEKGRTLPSNAREMVFEWSGVNRLGDAYGMSELMGANVRCSCGKFHINPWLIPYVLDVDTLDPLPTKGVVTGRLGGIDLMASSFWSGYISTDLVTLNYEGGCACGREGPYLEPEIRRVQNVEDDKISCAATPGAHDDTIEFLRAQGL